VWLCLLHRPLASLDSAPRNKLRQRYFGPYEITEIINPVAYRLALPPGTRLHNVFHVSLLKRFVGSPPMAPPALPPTHYGATIPVPAKALKARLYRGVKQILVQWKDHPRKHRAARAQDPDPLLSPARPISLSYTIKHGTID